MEFIRKHRKLSLIVLFSLILFLIIGLTLGRYIRNILHSFILETKDFYFTSNTLSVNGKNYLINNWDGVNSYTLSLDVKNRKNDNRYTKTDINYNITVDCPTTVTCTLSKTSSVLHPTDEDDHYTITVTPLQNFYAGDQINVNTSVSSTTPYVKSLFASYTIGVEKSNFSYDIVDSRNSKYLTLNLTNSITYYEVSEAFSTYSVGDQISVSDYNNLSATEQAKCFSAIITLEYDPTILFVDMTNNLYLNRLSTDYEEVQIGGFQYVKKFSFKVNASSFNSIIFYKDVITRNYTYPIVNATSIIDVSVVSAN